MKTILVRTVECYIGGGEQGLDYEVHKNRVEFLKQEDVISVSPIEVEKDHHGITRYYLEIAYWGEPTLK